MYDGVRGFARSILSTGGNVFKLDRLIIPVHVDNAHWCLVVAFVQERKIQCYDSIGQEGTRWMEALREYLRHEAEKWARDGTVARHLLALDEWTLVPTQTRETPQQNNGSDCGVFTCTFAECASEGRAMHFSYADVEFLRQKITRSLVKAMEELRSFATAQLRVALWDAGEAIRNLWHTTAAAERASAGALGLSFSDDIAAWGRVLAAFRNPASTAVCDGGPGGEAEVVANVDGNWSTYGFYNGASWCYQNAVLQALGLVQDFPAALAAADGQKENTVGGTAAAVGNGAGGDPRAALAWLFRLRANGESVHQPLAAFRSFAAAANWPDTPGFFDGARGQQDAHEFLLFLFDAVLGEDAAAQTFGFDTGALRWCTTPGCTRVFGAGVSERNCTLNLSVGTAPTTVGERLKWHFKEECVHDYQCWDKEALQGCSRVGTVTQRTELRNCPNCLLVVLKRYETSLDGTTTKLFTKVDCDETIDLASGGAAAATYDLVSMVMHCGRSAASGHYVAAGRDTTDHSRILFFDDANVEALTPEAWHEMRSGNSQPERCGDRLDRLRVPCILVYRRRGAAAGAGAEAAGAPALRGSS